MAKVSTKSAAAPRVLVVFDTAGAWSRGILRGFMAAAHERGWALLHYHPPSDFRWLARNWSPAVAVIGPELSPAAIAQLAPASVVSVLKDRTAEGIASVCLAEEHVATLAADHLLGTGLRHVTTFRFDDAPFAIARERAFVARARAAGANVAAGWGGDDARPGRREEDMPTMLKWLEQLPKPCGIFTGTDGWGRAVARYARAAGFRVPDDIALVGADNDVLECQLISPPLSSVAIPWQEVGSKAATLVLRALSGSGLDATCSVVEPIAVIGRGSSDKLAIDDPLVAKAVQWIQANAHRRITVPMVARAVASGRQRLERRFRSVLDRTVQEQIRRAHVDVAKGLLQTTGADLAEVAKRSGFTTAALLSVAFQRELGMPPGAYRRRLRREIAGAATD